MNFSLNSLFDKAALDLKNKRWVMVRYTDPFENTNIEIDQTEYRGNCSFKFLLEFKDHNKLVSQMNDKLTSIGKYKIEDNNKFEFVYPRIRLKLCDVQEKCHLDTEKRIIFQEMLAHATSYVVKENKLFINYKIEEKNIVGIIEFDLYQ